MKKFLFVLIFIPFSQHLFALNIRDVTVSRISQNTIDVSLTTEAIELYYFHSWEYSITGNDISINAFFVSGFGSTIAYLDNNFEIPLNADDASQHRLLIKIFYVGLSENADAPIFQDEFKLEFKTPFDETLIQSDLDLWNVRIAVSPNPTTGMLYISEDFDYVIVLDKLGREIIPIKFFYRALDLSGLENGTYYVVLFNQQRVARKRVLLEK